MKDFIDYFTMMLNYKNLPLLLILLYVIYRIYKFLTLKRNLPRLIKQGAQLIDVRSPAEFLGQHAEGSINIPLQELEKRLSEVKRDVPILVACASGARSAVARLILKRNGYAQVTNAGSWTNFRRSP